MGTYWDDFIDSLFRDYPIDKLSNLTPRTLCREFYKWLVSRPNIIAAIEREADHD